MHVVFMGTPEFAVPTLQHLVNSEFSVVGVVCQPDRPSGRGKKIQFGPVKTFALAQNLSVVQPEKMKDPAFSGDPSVMESGCHSGGCIWANFASGHS